MINAKCLIDLSFFIHGSNNIQQHRILSQVRTIFHKENHRRALTIQLLKCLVFFLCCPIMCLYILSLVYLIKRCSVRLYHQVFVGGLVSHFIFTLFGFVCAQWCPTDIGLFLVLFIFVLCLVCPLLPVSLDCPFLITPSVYLTFIYERIKRFCMFINGYLAHWMHDVVRCWCSARLKT